MIKTIFWDFDGTIFDTYPAINKAFQLACEKFDVEISMEEIAKLTRVSMSHCIKKVAANHDLIEEKLWSSYREIYPTLPQDYQIPFPGVKTFCKDFIQDGGQHFIITHRNPTSTEILLKNHNMETLFVEWIAPHLGFKRKPDPEMVIYLLEKYQLKSKECLMVGDRDLDLIPAHESGLFTCAYGNGKFDFKATWHIDNYAHLSATIYNHSC